MSQKPLARLIFFSVFFTLVVVGYIVLSQKEQPREQIPFETHQLLKKLPPHTVAFYSWRSDVPSYASLRQKTPLHSTNTLLGQINKLPLPESQQRLIETLINAVQSSGLINKDTGSPEGILEFLGFIQDRNSKPELAFNIIANDQINLSTLASSLKTALENEQIPVTQKSEGSKTILSVTSPSLTLHGVFDQHTASIATSEDLIKEIFASNETTGFAEIRSNPKYHKLLSETSLAKDQFGVGIADMDSLAALAKTSSPSTNPQDLDDIPFSAVSVSQYATDQLRTEILFELTPKNDQQKLLIKNVSRPAENSLVQRMPEDTALLAIFDGQLIHTLQEGAVSDLSPEEKQAAEEWGKLIATFEGVSIGALPAGREALVPDIFVTIQSKKAGELSAVVEDQTRQLISTQIPMANWLDKTIDGVQIKYILTPLGIGLYLASVNDIFIAASTENAITSVIASANGKAPPAGNNPIFKQSVNSMILGTLDFKKIADAIESVQGSMSLFTGGASTLNADQIQDLKRLGTAAFTASVANGLLKLEWDLKPAT